MNLLCAPGRPCVRHLAQGHFLGACGPLSIDEVTALKTYHERGRRQANDAAAALAEQLLAREAELAQVREAARDLHEAAAEAWPDRPCVKLMGRVLEGKP